MRGRIQGPRRKGGRALCDTCGWKELFTRRGRARREAASHRCDPRARRARQRLQQQVPRGEPASVAALLEAAAETAARQPTVIQAIDAAWTTLNSDRRHAGRAFGVWGRAELYRGDLRGLGGFLRSRYHTVQQVTGSLRAAGGLLHSPA